jgi:hypothetical protein
MRKAVFYLCLLMLVPLLTQCASLAVRYTGTLEDAVRYINLGDAKGLVKLSGVPFLCDREIVLLDKDLGIFWGNLVGKKFSLKNPVFGKPVPIDGQTYKEFASTMEVESFFSNYLSDKACWVKVETGDFRLTLLLDTAKNGATVIRGWKGPDAL